MLDEPWNVAIVQSSRVDLQHRPAVTERNIVTDALAHMHRDAEFLIALPHERLDLGLPRLHLPARKLPPTCELRGLGAGTGKDTATLDDGRPDDYSGHRPFGLHEPSECQINREMYAPPSLWLPHVGYVGSRQSVLAGKH
jgi:hypothetical protein